MQICMDIKYIIDLFVRVTSLLILLCDLKAYFQVYKPSVVLEQTVCADAQNQISELKLWLTSLCSLCNPLNGLGLC